MIPHFCILVETQLADDIRKFRDSMRVLFSFARLRQLGILAETVTGGTGMIDSGRRHALFRLGCEPVRHTLELVDICANQV